MLPHLASNTVFYGNPLYPFAQSLFNGVTDPRLMAEQGMVDWGYKAARHPVGALRARAEMSFSSRSFRRRYSFVNNLPMFGSGFTLSLPLLVAIRKTDVVCGRARSSRWARSSCGR